MTAMISGGMPVTAAGMFAAPVGFDVGPGRGLERVLSVEILNKAIRDKITPSIATDGDEAMFLLGDSTPGAHATDRLGLSVQARGVDLRAHGMIAAQRQIAAPFVASMSDHRGPLGLQ